MNWFEYIAPFFNWLGLTIPDLSLVVSIMCGLLFGVADYRIGLMSCLMILISVASFFIAYGFDTMRVFVLIFSCIVIMALSLFVESSNRSGGLL